MNSVTVVLVALGGYRNISLRIMHSLLERIKGVNVHTIFFKDFEGRFFSHPTKKEKELFQEVINKLKPDLVGFSATYPYFPMSKTLIKIVRTCSPSSLIILGGVYPTVDPEQCIKESDMLCVGEGEGVIIELVEALRDKKPYHSVGSLWVRHDEKVIMNPMRPLLLDLDSLPFPSYGNPSYYFINKNKLTRKDSVLSNNELYLITSRGCPFVCSYCINSLLRQVFKGLGPYTRRRSVDSIIKEIKENLNLPGSGTNYIYFFDEVFSSDEKWLDEFCSQYKQEIGLPFQVSYNPKELSDVIVKKLVNVGLDAINFGIQSGSDYIRNHIFNRAGKNREIIDFARKISRYKIIMRHDMILDNPYETEENLKEAVDLLLHLPKELSMNLYSLQFFPNHPLTKKAVSDKRIVPIDTTDDSAIEKTAKNLGFVPTLLPYTRKMALQNIIWLIAGNHIKDSLVRYGVFGSSWGSRLCFFYMNFKAVILGKIIGEGGIMERSRFSVYFMKTMNYFIKGDFNGFWIRVKRRLRYQDSN